MTNTKVEKEEKEKLVGLSLSYRPGEKKPELPELKENSNLVDFIRYALLNNPEVESAFYQWKSAVEIIPASRYIPYPVFSLESEIDSNMASLMSGLMVMLPAPGKVQLSAEATSLEARKKRYLFENEILKTAFQVKDVSYRFWVLREKIKLTESILGILKELEDLSLARLKVGQASQTDTLTIQIEKEQIVNLLRDLNDSKNVLNAQFGALLGLAPGSKIPDPPGKLPFTEEIFPEEKIWEVVRLKNPRLSFMENEIKENEIFVKLAYKEYLPDFSISLSKMFFSEMAILNPRLTLSLPWRRKIAALLASAQSNVKMSRAQYSAEELDLAVMLADGLFRWRQANREFKLYKENLLPKVQATLEVNKANYTTGISGFADYLATERMFLEFSFNYLSSQAFREIALNEISIVVAGVLPEREIIFQEAK